jgi:SdpI/YfhL protein family
VPTLPIVSPATVLVVLGLATAVIALPLLVGVVRPNRFYGIRVRQAFLSEKNWYSINEYGAKRMLLFSVAVASTGFLLRGLPQAPFWLPILGLVFALVLLLATVRSIMRHAESLP